MSLGTLSQKNKLNVRQKNRRPVTMVGGQKLRAKLGTVVRLLCLCLRTYGQIKVYAVNCVVNTISDIFLPLYCCQQQNYNFKLAL